MKNKLVKAGLNEDAAKDVADVLTFADHRGIHSHGAVRVEYYAERIAKGGITANPEYQFEQTGPSTGVFEGIMALDIKLRNKRWKKQLQWQKKMVSQLLG